jgi:aspartate kinase
MSLAQAPARRVHKFGGASLSDGTAIRRVGAILRERAPERPIAVVSAAEGVTSMLDALAASAAEGDVDVAPVRIRHRSLLAQLALDAELVDRHLAELTTVLRAASARRALTSGERDHVLSFGERMSARIVAGHLASLGLRAVPIDAFDLGLVTDSNHGRARVLPESRERVRRALTTIDAIPVITGFVAADLEGRLTTLGRNGSDLTAALIGEAIGAAEVCFWKEVAGVMSADPRLVPDARIVREVGYADAAEFARHGASVLHGDAIEPLERARIPARVLCARTPHDAGTVIGAAAERAPAVGIACRRGLCRARVAFASDADARLWLDAVSDSVEALHSSVAGGEALLVAPWSDALGPILLGASPRVEIERELAAVVAVGRSIDAQAVRAAIERGGARVIAAWPTGSAATSLCLVRESELAPAARAAHACALETQGLQERRSA